MRQMTIVLRLLVPIAAIGIAAMGGCSGAPEGRARKSLKLTGTVLEQVHAPPYTYLRVKTDAGEVWAMVPTASVSREERVTVTGGVLLKNFDTGLPGRRFDVIMGTLEKH